MFSRKLKAHYKLKGHEGLDPDVLQVGENPASPWSPNWRTP